MSQSRARLFEKWLNAGDDRTFGEWLAYRRQCVMQVRQQRALEASLPWQQALLRVQIQHRYATPRFGQAMVQALGGALGGFFR